MHATTVGIDLAKHRFELALREPDSSTIQRLRLPRTRVAEFFANHSPCHIVLEACGSAQHWGRTLQAQGHAVQLLPAQYVRAYVRRNKTDAADAAALLEAARCGDLRPVPIKSVDQQLVLQLHRLRPWIAETLAEIDDLHARMRRLEAELVALTREDPVVHQLLEIPGIGPLGATALRAAVGDIRRFPSGRHFASWLGLTAREHSSGERRRLGRISKRGDPYLRTLLVHGARAALLAAQRAQRQGRPLDRLSRWGLAIAARCGHNKAVVALANKLARIVWATWSHQRPFERRWDEVA